MIFSKKKKKSFIPFLTLPLKLAICPSVVKKFGLPKGKSDLYLQLLQVIYVTPGKNIFAMGFYGGAEHPRKTNHVI